MTTATLYTVQEVARLLHVSDDTVRRQIREGDLSAVRIGTTPKGRPRYRIPATAVEQKLIQTALEPTSALERFRALFEELSDQKREELLEKATQWARAQSIEAPGQDQHAALSKEELAQQLSLRAKALLEANKKE